MTDSMIGSAYSYSQSVTADSYSYVQIKNSMTARTISFSVSSIPSGLFLYYTIGSTVSASSSLTSYTGGSLLTVPIGSTYYMYGFNQQTSGSLSFTISFTGSTVSSYDGKCLNCMIATSTQWYCTAEAKCYGSQPTCASKTQNLFNCNPQNLQVGQIDMTDSMIGSAYSYSQSVTADSYSYVQIKNSMTARTISFSVSSIPSGLFLYYTIGSTVSASSSLTSYTGGSLLTVPIGSTYYMYGFNQQTSGSLSFTISFTGSTVSSYDGKCLNCMIATSTQWYCTAEAKCYGSQPTCASKTQNLFNCNPQNLQVGQIDMTDSMIGSAYSYSQSVTADSYSYVQIKNSMTARTISFSVSSIPSGLFLYYTIGSTVSASSSLTSYTGGSLLTVPIGSTYYMYGFNLLDTDSSYILKRETGFSQGIHLKLSLLNLLGTLSFLLSAVSFL
eukprot:403367416